MALLSKLFNFVIINTKKYSIDESHGLSHSMNVLNYTYNIYKSKIDNTPSLKEHEKIIFISAILHDMCDKKYLPEKDGLNEIKILLNNEISNEEIEIIQQIISTMSYSTVKKNGFPKLNKYQLAYHIVREGDLLAAIDFDRCMIYNMNRMNGNIIQAYENSLELFKIRMFKHNQDHLYITQYSKEQDLILKKNAINRIINWNNIIKNNIYI